MTEDIRKILDEYKDETKRHFDVVAEDLKSEIQTVAEQAATNTEQITAIQEKLGEYDKRFDTIEGDLGIIKLDIEIIKNDLKEKVSREEFIILEKRVGILEAKRK